MAAVALGWVQRQVFPPGHWWFGAGRGILAASAPGVIAVIGVYAALTRWGGWGWRDLGWPGGAAALRGAATGLVWGLGMAALAVGLSVAGGARIVVAGQPGESYLAAALPILAGLAAAALLEELLFRGFPLQRLARATGRVGAATTLAVAFAGAHLGNPETSVLGLANIGLASLLLSAVFFSTGGLAAAWGVHLGWNAGLVLTSDAPVSGLRFGLPSLEFFPGPHGWWTGGRFGPEGGAVTAIVMAAALVWWVRRGFTMQGV